MSIVAYSIKMLEIYFPNFRWRYIGAGHRNQFTTVRLVLDLLELGFMGVGDLQAFVNVVFDRLENLN